MLYDETATEFMTVCLDKNWLHKVLKIRSVMQKQWKVYREKLWKGLKNRVIFGSCRNTLDYPGGGEGSDHVLGSCCSMFLFLGGSKQTRTAPPNASVDSVLGWISHLVNSFTVGRVSSWHWGIWKAVGVKGQQVKGHWSFSISFHSSMAQFWPNAAENKDLTQQDWTAERWGQ